MLRLGHTDYRLCLLDTNAVSEMVKNHTREFRNYLAWSMATQPTFVPTFSLLTVVELRRSPVVYRAFLELFSVIPCVFVKSFEQLVADEASHYPDPSRVEPCLLGFAGPLAQAGLAEVLDMHFGTHEGREQERKLNAEIPGIIDGITSLVANYPPGDGKTYTSAEVQAFVEIAGFQQIAMRERRFAEQMVSNGRAVELDAFPSVKAATYTVFHKFYTDRERRPSDSDAFDIIISSATPYVDAIVTENHQAEALRKTKRRDGFLAGLKILTLRDLRQEHIAGS